jgi:tetratricopeptide (TPR) repeat protein
LTAAQADEVILKNNRVYSGVIEKWTTESVTLFDGNLRRILPFVNIRRVIQERPDTSWILVGDRMMRQGDWETAAKAYRRGLDVTTEPDTILQRLELLKRQRYDLPNSEEATALYQAGHYRKAAALFTALVQASEGLGQKHYWTDWLARAYAGLARGEPEDGPRKIVDYLVYAFAIAPDCGPAHTVLAEYLQHHGFNDPAREEWLLALDLDPLDVEAQTQLASIGADWTYDPEGRAPEDLRLWAQRPPVVTPSDEAFATTEPMIRYFRHQLVQAAPSPVCYLLGSYLMNPTAVLCNRGRLPYPEFDGVIEKTMKQIVEEKAAEKYDPIIIREAVKVRIDPRLIRAIARVRSSFDAAYVSPRGERGLVPLRADQWAVAAEVAGVDWTFEANANDVEKNVQMACTYLDYLRRRVLPPYTTDSLDRLERIN